MKKFKRTVEYKDFSEDTITFILLGINVIFTFSYLLIHDEPELAFGVLVGTIILYSLMYACFRYFNKDVYYVEEK